MDKIQFHCLFSNKSIVLIDFLHSYRIIVLVFITSKYKKCSSFVWIRKYYLKISKTFLGPHCNSLINAILFNWFNMLDHVFILIFCAPPEKFVCAACYIYWPIHFNHLYLLFVGDLERASGEERTVFMVWNFGSWHQLIISLFDCVLMFLFFSHRFRAEDSNGK